MGLIPVPYAAFTFFFFSFNLQYPNSLNPVREKKEGRIEDRTSEKKEKKKKTEPRRRKGKKKVKGQKVRL